MMFTLHNNFCYRKFMVKKYKRKRNEIGIERKQWKIKKNQLKQMRSLLKALKKHFKSEQMNSFLMLDLFFSFVFHLVYIKNMESNHFHFDCEISSLLSFAYPVAVWWMSHYLSWESQFFYCYTGKGRLLQMWSRLLFWVVAQAR